MAAQIRELACAEANLKQCVTLAPVPRLFLHNLRLLIPMTVSPYVLSLASFAAFSAWTAAGKFRGTPHVIDEALDCPPPRGANG